ncbi:MULTISPECIES: hypothetical protein [unclassified Neisseria]|uniref:hypothetical protein n=1 Tax=unclassified Neisseria TaxID=2623750 RepID=UPI00114D22B5|nr:MULTISPECIES: hypothetical protein [unclassified Neisseria]
MALLFCLLSRKNTKVGKTAQITTESEKHYTLIMSESMHQELKKYCAQHGISLKDFVIQAIQNEMQQ